jgi:aspartate/methionine/tyrosine aminotransferase
LQEYNEPANPAAVEAFHALDLMSRRVQTMRAAGRSVIHMALGQPSTGAPPKAVAAARSALESDPLGYWESEELKKKIAGLDGQRYGLDVDPERVILTAGASPALLLALMLSFAPGDGVAIVRPGYVAYRNVLRSLHMRPLEIPTGPSARYQIDVASLATLAVPPAGLILASPANPSGTLIDPPVLEAVADHCRSRG